MVYCWVRLFWQKKAVSAVKQEKYGNDWKAAFHL